MQMRFEGPMVLSPNIFLIFIYIIILGLLLYRTKALPAKTYNADFIAKDNTNYLRGVCVLLILTHHFSLQMFDASFLVPMKDIGVFAVALFFFLSSYGMTVSLTKNPDYLKTFLVKRFSKIYIPYLIINTITVIIMMLFYDADYSTRDIVLMVSGIKLVDASLWFVHRILIYYVVFYLSFKLLNKNVALAAVVLFTIAYCIICAKLGRGIWEFRTAFSFPLGIFFGLYHKKIYEVVTNNYTKTITLSTICLIATIFVYSVTSVFNVFELVTGALASVVVIIQVLLLLMKVKVSSKAFSLLGKVSYEIYLVHMKVLVITYSIVEITESYFLYIYIGIVVLAAYSMNKTLSQNVRGKLKARSMQAPRVFAIADRLSTE